MLDYLVHILYSEFLDFLNMRSLVALSSVSKYLHDIVIGLRELPYRANEEMIFKQLVLSDFKSFLRCFPSLIKIHNKINITTEQITELGTIIQDISKPRIIYDTYTYTSEEIPRDPYELSIEIRGVDKCQVAILDIATPKLMLAGNNTTIRLSTATSILTSGGHFYHCNYCISEVIVSYLADIITEITIDNQSAIISLISMLGQLTKLKQINIDRMHSVTVLGILLTHIPSTVTTINDLFGVTSDDSLISSDIAYDNVKTFIGKHCSAFIKKLFPNAIHVIAGSSKLS